MNSSIIKMTILLFLIQEVRKYKEFRVDLSLLSTIFIKYLESTYTYVIGLGVIPKVTPAHKRISVSRILTY